MRAPDEFTLVLLALASGMVIPVQAGINAALARRVGHPVEAALASFCIGTVALLAYCLLLRLPRPSISTLSGTPLYLWSGGLLGAFLVAVTAFVAPRMGASAMIGCIIASQLIMSLFLDHFGLLGFRVHPLNVGRLLGAVLLLAGMALLRRF